MIYLSTLAIMAFLAITTAYILNSMPSKTSFQKLRRVIVIAISILLFLVIATYLFTHKGYY